MSGISRGTSRDTSRGSLVKRHIENYEYRVEFEEGSKARIT